MLLLHPPQQATKPQLPHFVGQGSSVSAFFFLVVVLRFELTASHLQGRSLLLEALPSPPPVFFDSLGSEGSPCYASKPSPKVTSSIKPTQIPPSANPEVRQSFT
jgi:hypothetical protein